MPPSTVTNVSDLLMPEPLEVTEVRWRWSHSGHAVLGLDFSTWQVYSVAELIEVDGHWSAFWYGITASSIALWLGDYPNAQAAQAAVEETASRLVVSP